MKLISDLICAEQGAIAETVLLPGDPLRAQYLAEHYLENAVCYNTTRGLYGYTGTYRGVRVSVQGTGMGTSSIMECAFQLVEDYGCKNLIRIGTCGSSDPNIHVGDTILSIASAAESNNTVPQFGEYDFVPTSNFELLKTAYDCAHENGIAVHVGTSGCGDVLYKEPDQPETYRNPWKGYPMIAVEMEGTGLLVAAARYPHVRGLLLITCSDHQLYSNEDTPLAQRETAYNNMMKVALETAYKMDKEAQ